MNRTANFATDSRPVPDPTVLTTQQLLREVDRLQGLIDKLPEQARSEVRNLQALHEERFASIATQFAERDKRTEQLSLADKTAIAAALQAQKEAAGAQNEANAAAIAKSEAGFTKQIDQILTLISANMKSADDKNTDLKDRIAAMEGQASGSDKTSGRTSSAISLIIAGSVALIVFVTAIVGVITFVTRVH